EQGRMSVSIEYKNIGMTWPRASSPALFDVNLSVCEGEILALVGESGSGKTTLLRLTAGLERPDTGEILLGGSIVAGTGGWVAPEQRRVGMVFQEGALFPHRTVGGNIRYGLTKRSRTEQTSRVEELLELVGLNGYEKRYPHELSGGERQRVALARALAPKPDVILLDEPFSNLDSTLRSSIRDEICDILKGLNTTVILVVHDPEDALSVGDRVAILKDGRLEQVATPYETWHEPANQYCANLFGPANELPQSDGPPIWVRPEEFRVTENGQAKTYRAEVLRVRETGKYLDLIVRPDQWPNLQWLIRDRAGLHLQPGDDMTVAWTGRKNGRRSPGEQQNG
ncbi:MAG: ABC transporter ATP-binding protein, partial [Verrucomicrobiota bacterium]